MPEITRDYLAQLAGEALNRAQQAEREAQQALGAYQTLAALLNQMPAPPPQECPEVAGTPAPAPKARRRRAA